MKRLTRLSTDRTANNTIERTLLLCRDKFLISQRCVDEKENQEYVAGENAWKI